MSTDSQLIARSITHPSAFGPIFQRHAAAIHRYAARRAGPGVADDVTSATFLTAFDRRAQFDTSRDDAGPWLYGIATNLIHRHRVAEARMLHALERSAAANPPQEFSDDLAEAAETRLEVRRLARELRRLSIRDRDCLLLYAWQGLSYEEVAEAMSVPVGTVRSRLNRARRILRTGSPAALSRESDSPDTTAPDTTTPAPARISTGTAHFTEAPS